MAGTRFALLRRPFRHRPSRPPGGHRIVVLLGGSPSDASLAFAASVIDRLPSSLAVDVVSNRRLPTQRKLAHNDWLADVRPVLERATIALSAAGSTVWELCATGVVPVIFAAAANQQPVGVALGEMSEGATRTPSERPPISKNSSVTTCTGSR